jgi:hypothetical protein
VYTSMHFGQYSLTIASENENINFEFNYFFS